MTKMTKKDFNAVIDRIVEIPCEEERKTILNFFLRNGGFFNPRFSSYLFHERYNKKMKEKGE